MINYLEVLTKHYPNCVVECFGDPETYSNITLVSGPELPSELILINKYTEDLKISKITELSQACALDIISGFESNALGEPHYYDSEEVDQLNLIGSVASTAPMSGYPEGLASEFACRPVINGVIQPKEYKLHTYANFRLVIYHGVLVKLDKLKRFNDLRNYILSTELTIEELHAVTY